MCVCDQTGLSSLVLRKKRPLIAAFTQVDKASTGYISKDRWCQVMDSVSYRVLRLTTLVVSCVLCADLCSFLPQVYVLILQYCFVFAPRTWVWK